MKKIIKSSHDMIYYISMLSTTGGKLKVSPKKIIKKYNEIKKLTGKEKSCDRIRITDKTITNLRQADGLVVGSQLCKGITESLKKRQNPVTNLNRMVYNLKKKNNMNWIKNKILSFVQKAKDKFKKERPSKADQEKKVCGSIVLNAIRCSLKKI